MKNERLVELVNVLLDECYVNIDDIKTNINYVYNNIYEFLCNRLIDVVEEINNINYEVGCNINCFEVFEVFKTLEDYLK